MSDPFTSDDYWSDDPLGGPEAAYVPADPYPFDTRYLEGLNPVQRLAVEALEGPVLLLAGAGTGKTRVLTTRLAHLLITKRATPFQVLAVTFTNKAAQEMRERVGELVGGGVEGWWLGTFHALAARMLRKHAELVGLSGNFTILDTDDQLRLIKQLLEAANIDVKKWPPRQVLGVIERWKDRGITPDRATGRNGRGGGRERDGEAGEAVGGKAPALYAAYQERLKTLNACDFGDLLLHVLTIFQKHPDVLADYHRRFRYIMVDEYQDTNVSQYLWLRLLAQGHRNLCCVGDEDQSIYGWRGAEIGNILRFEADFPGAEIIKLEENYRSTGHILAAATSLIGHNRSRLGKTLWTAAGEGIKVRVSTLWDSVEEARWVGEEIEAAQRKGAPLREMAVLVRTGAQTREFEDRFMTLGLPYRVIGGPRFYERQEIRDAMAYFRVINQPADDLAFERIVNLPKRGVGPAALALLGQVGRDRGLPMTTVAWAMTETDELKPKLRQSLRGLLQNFERWRDMAKRIPHVDLARMVLDESGYTRMWQEDKTPEAPGRLDNLKELMNAMGDFENLQGFLEHVALVMEANQGSGDDKVSIMTMHGAKGLEFDIVFLPGWEEGLFPNKRALDENGQAGLEEERRLAYVGLTRAKRRAIVCSAQRRRVYSTWLDTLPSRFLMELPAEHVEGDAPAPAKAGYLADDGSAGRSYGFRESSAPSPFARPYQPRPAVVEASARRIEVARRPCPYPVGSRVFHQKFGGGTVTAVEGDKLEIDFDHAGVKKVMESFVSAVK